MLIRGHGDPSGSRPGSRGVSRVHGQPDLPWGGAGNSSRLGQRISYHSVRDMLSDRTDQPVIARFISVRRLLGRIRANLRARIYGTLLTFELTMREARLRLMAAGFPLRREFLVLHCMGGSDASGFFSELAAVLGALQHFEHWKAQYAGIHVYFDERGLYHDPRYGANWWEYFFEPIEIGSKRDAITRVISNKQHDHFANQAEQRIPRTRGAALAAAYVRPAASMLEQVEAYVRANFAGNFVVGVNYRGTDKHEDARRVPYEEVRAAIHDVLRAATPWQYRIYLATDEQAFLDYMRGEFPDTLLCRDMFRSIDGRPIDVTNDDGNYQKGKDAVLDCLLLSRANYLIRTASNLSLCATFFNLNAPEILLNRPFQAPD